MVLRGCKIESYIESLIASLRKPRALVRINLVPVIAQFANQRQYGYRQSGTVVVFIETYKCVSSHLPRAV
jgi:hypothetical protein